MKIYELTFILNPNLDEEALKAEINKVESQIKGLSGTILEIQNLGKKGFAYILKGHRQGTYITIYYQADPSAVRQIETSLKLNEQILRFLTLVLSPSEYKPRAQEESVTK